MFAKPTDHRITIGTVLIKKGIKYIVIGTEIVCAGNVRLFFIVKQKILPVFPFVKIKEIADNEISQYEIFKY